MTFKIRHVKKIKIFVDSNKYKILVIWNFDENMHGKVFAEGFWKI